MGFRGSLWGRFHSDSDCGVPCAMVANGATRNMCVHDADMRNHHRAARALAFAVAAECERRFERTTGPDLGLSARRRLADLNPRFFGHIVMPSHR
eukprot:363722-Chlamydomonas_euryale.AAC.4